MRLWVLAIGDRMPDWVEAAVAEYGTRMPAHLRVEWRGLPLARRGRTGSPDLWRREEGKRLLAATPAGAERVALDPAGRLLTSDGLARQVGQWLAGGRDVALWVGGPDGLDPALTPDWRWSLSPLTLSHPVVRVVLAEQLYRGWSIHAGLPYHRGA